MVWHYEPNVLRPVLEEMGFDIDPESTEDPSDHLLIGRQHRADRRTDIVIDAGGHIRITITTMKDDERREPIQLNETVFQVTSETTTTTTASGTLTDNHSFRDTLAVLIAELVESEYNDQFRRRWTPPTRRD